MIFLKYALDIGIGFSGGILVAAGLFALITSLGIITRLAQVSHSAYLLIFYENVVIAGTILGNVLWLYMSITGNESMSDVGAGILTAMNRGILGVVGKMLSQTIWCAVFSNTCDIIFGLLSGIYVGCMIGAIAEILDAFPIFFRRLSIEHAGSLIVIVLALGKVIGVLLQYFG